MFLGQGILWEQVWSSLKEIRQEVQAVKECRTAESLVRRNDNLRDCTNRFKASLSHIENTNPPPTPENNEVYTSQKRRRSSDVGYTQCGQSPTASTTTEQIRPSESWLPDSVVDELVDLYISNIHPWIPVLHIKRFKQRMADAQQRRQLRTIFHAIASVCARYSRNVFFNKPGVRTELAKRSKHEVILNSMESFSVENLQALVIIAFDTVRSPFLKLFPKS